MILSGVRFTSEAVKKQTNRHKVVTLFNKLNPGTLNSSLKHPSCSKIADICLVRNPEPPTEDIPLYICTPRATSPAIVPHREYQWPKSLPWIHFNESLLPELLSGLRLLPPDQPETAITTQRGRPRKKRRLDSPGASVKAWTAFKTLSRRSMEIVIGSEELSRFLLINRSVDRLAAYFDDMLPPTYPGENLRRAIALSGGAQYEMQKEVLKVLMFLASNHLIMDCLNGLPSRNYTNDARAFVDIFHFSGLSQPSTLLKIVKVSRESPTLASLVNMLYEAAVHTESIDIVLGLFKADDLIHPNQPAGKIVWHIHLELQTWSALEYGLICGSLDLSRQTITNGADINHQTGNSKHLSPFVLAMFPETDRTIQLIELLLERDVGTSDQVSEASHAAVCKGSIELIDILYRAGADFTSMRLIQDHYDFELVLNRGWLDHPYFIYSSDLNTSSCLGLAASYVHWRTAREKYEKHDGDADSQSTALELVKHILGIWRADLDIDNQLKSDAMILAAFRGYTNVISFLYQRGARVDVRNGLFCPVYAAVSEAQVECCRLLLELGGSAQPYYCSKVHGDPIRLCSPMHAAVNRNSCELIDPLLLNGADVNSPHIPCFTFSTWARFCDQDKADDKSIQNLSPLGLAVSLSHWEIASLLLDRGATSTDGSITCAVRGGQSQLVSRLLKLRVDSDKNTQEYRDALEISIDKGHETIALNLIESGVPVTNSTLNLALQRGRIRIAVKIIDTGIQLTRPELVGLFRIPNLSTIQSLLQDTSADTIIGERSSDGRSFVENAILSGDVAVMKLLRTYT